MDWSVDWRVMGLLIEDIDEKMFEGDQVWFCRSPRFIIHVVDDSFCSFIDSSPILEDTKMYYPPRSSSTPRLRGHQITCLYDMDIVFNSNRDFDEVYLYVCYLLVSLLGSS